ncbi:MAG: asparagine synthase (glutamine-hydrolyzing) [Gammaproteobacteria bacterium GWE2_42_36]|nr:MAG: asparagine synthase (glutamine-hydrolyzing) [Gammaproteobacteria bacterium GWE2_42_36]
MCGISGFYSDQIKNQNSRERLLKTMLKKIAHRGPDGQGEFFHQSLSLGHVRLSIIDLEQGVQPMISNDGRYVIAFNGEIYNYLELRRDLIQKDHQFTTSSDTEVLLNLFIEYGEKCLDHLNGMFAFVIFDKKNDSLFIARDQFGIKPFYYTTSEGQFIFASEIKSILAFPNVYTGVDEHSLHEYLTFQMILKKHTLFKNIFKLEPATYMIIKKGRIVEKKCYWEVKYHVDEKKSVEQFSDELLALLENTIQHQMRSDVPVGTYLSGGLDSSIVTALASKNHELQLHTFTGGFKEHQKYDETRYAKIVSDYSHCKNHVIYPNALDFINHFETLIYHMDEPAGGPGIFPQYMVSKLASKYVKVVLGGQGGDEIFGGYARYAIAYLEQCLKGAIFETQNKSQYVATWATIAENLPLLKQYVPLLKYQFAEGLFDDIGCRYFRLIDRSPNLQHIYRQDFLSHGYQESLFNKYLQIFDQPSTPSYLNKMTNFDRMTLLPTLLHVEDRMSMAMSLESRVPLLDKRIVELAAAMPPLLKFYGGKPKAMLLKASKNILPQEILNRKDKMGFPTPFNEWLAGPLKEYVLDILTGQTAVNRGMINVAGLEKQIRSNDLFGRDIWGALNIEVWFRTFIDQC